MDVHVGQKRKAAGTSEDEGSVSSKRAKFNASNNEEDSAQINASFDQTNDLQKDPMNNSVTLPTDCWNIVLQHLTENEEKEFHWYCLAFISSTSKAMKSICETFKQRHGIDLSKKPRKTLLNFCASNGYLSGMVYLHQNGHQFDIRTTDEASPSGHLDCLKYAHENGAEWHGNSCLNSAMNGHLDVLKYAHEHGCPWDEDTCAGTGILGQLECLKYAHENGCPWHEETCTKAVRGGNLEILKSARMDVLGMWNKRIIMEPSIIKHALNIFTRRLVHTTHVIYPQALIKPMIQ